MNKERGMSYRRISAWFNKSGIKTHHGKSWSETGSHAHMIVKRMHESQLRLAQSRYKTKSEIRDFRINDGNLENMTRELQEDYRNLDLHKDFEYLLHQDEQQK